MSDGLLRIGAFSRASGLSIKALRAYHESGLLVPASVDTATGYRSYHASQLVDAALIAKLRGLDLPLADVRRVVDARDPQVTAEVLEAHGALMRQRLADTVRIVDELQAAAPTPAVNTPVHVKTAPHQHTLAIRGIVGEAELPSFLDAAYAELAAVTAASTVVPSGPAGALYPYEIADDSGQPIEAFIPIARPAGLPDRAGRVVVSEVPAAEVAALVHAGSYETIGDTYRQLGAWVAYHAEPRPLAVREHYVVSYDTTDDPAAFRTEIHFPITASIPPPGGTTDDR